MKRELSVKALSNSQAEVLIYDEIGQSFWGDSVDAKTFKQNIDQLDATHIVVRVDSPGGDIFDGIAIMNALKNHPAKVTAYVDGLAASAASIITTGADEVIMSEGSQMMIHDAWSWVEGHAKTIRKQADLLDKISNDMAEIYARKAGTPTEEWREAMQEETWFTAKEAVAVGLADRHDAETTVEPDFAAFAGGKILAKFKYQGREQAPQPKLPPEKEPTMTLKNDIAKMLGMTTDDPTDEQLKAAIAEVIEEQDDAEKTPAVVKKTAPVDEEDEDDNTVIVDKDVWEDTKRRAAAADEITQNQKEELAASLIDEHGIRAGRLLGWQRDEWVTKAIENFDKTKASLMKLADGTIPLAEKGRGGSDESLIEVGGSDDQDLLARAAAHNLFPDKY